MAEGEVYEKTHRSTIHRLKDRGSYDHAKVHSIIDSAPVLHVSFNPTSIDDDPFPTILPMLGCTGSYTALNARETSPIAIYLHGHSTSRFMQFPASEDNNSLKAIEGWLGTPVCVAATHLDGLVLALTPFNHSCNYRSAVVHGWANVVSDPLEKDYALELITNNMLPNRWDNTRVPPTAAEFTSTGVIRVDIVSASAKTRAYSAGNDKTDLADKEVMERVWTGVVPAFLTYGKPVPAEENKVGMIPDYIKDWLKDENEKNESYARSVTRLKAPKKS